MAVDAETALRVVDEGLRASLLKHTSSLEDLVHKPLTFRFESALQKNRRSFQKGRATPLLRIIRFSEDQDAYGELVEQKA